MPRANAHLKNASEYLAQHGETRAGALAEALGCDATSLRASLKGAVERGELLERREGRAKFYRMADQEPAAEAAPVTAAQPDVRWTHWDDGDIVMYGLVENDDGSHTIPADVVAAIKARLAWSPVR